VRTVSGPDWPGIFYWGCLVLLTAVLLYAGVTQL
jgi:hypothetical protein